MSCIVIPESLNCLAHSLGWLVLAVAGLVLASVVVRALLYSGYVAIKSSGSKQRDVLITGCDSGFGNQLTHRLAATGLRVFAACLTEDAVEQFESMNNPNILAFQMNICSEEDVAAGVEFVSEHSDALWAVVNNAGINEGFLTEWTPMSSYEKVMAVNYFGGVRVTKAFMPLVLNAKGRIVNVCSAAGILAGGCMGTYNASKFAFEAFSDTLRREMRMWGVKVVILEPGFFATPLVKGACNMLKEFTDKVPEEMKARWPKGWLEKRLRRASFVTRSAGNPEKVVDAMMEGIMAKHPKTRYRVGKDCHFFYFPLSILPTCISDFVIHKLAG